MQAPADRLPRPPRARGDGCTVARLPLAASRMVLLAQAGGAAPPRGGRGAPALLSAQAGVLCNACRSTTTTSFLPARAGAFRTCGGALGTASSSRHASGGSAARANRVGHTQVLPAQAEVFQRRGSAPSARLLPFRKRGCCGWATTLSLTADAPCANGGTPHRGITVREFGQSPPARAGAPEWTPAPSRALVLPASGDAPVRQQISMTGDLSSPRASGVLQPPRRLWNA